MLLPFSLCGQGIRPVIDSLLAEIERGNHGMGASISVFHRGEEIYNGVSGYADIATGRRSDGDTRYGTASIAKVYTATVILKLVEQGILTLDTPVGRFYPELENAESTTIEHLLRHTGGIAVNGYNGRLWEQILANEPNAKELLYDRLIAVSGMAEPGTVYKYANANYMLLAWIAADVSGKSFTELLAEIIFTPLDIPGTYPRTLSSWSEKEAIP